MDILSTIFAALAAGAAVCAIMTFIYSRKKDAVNEEKEDAEHDKKSIAEQVRLESTLEYIRQGVDDIRIDQRAQAAELKQTNEKLVRLEEHMRDQDRRIERLEGKQ